MKKIISILLLLILSLSFTACSFNTSGKVGVYSAQVECGKYFRAPILSGVDMDEVEITYVDPDGKERSCLGGLFQLEKVGEYKVKYSYDGKTKEISVQSTKDVSAPYFLTAPKFKNVYNLGEVISSGFTVSDPSGYDKEITNAKSFRFYFEEEQDPCYVGYAYVPNRTGNYRVELTLKDTLGNTEIFKHNFKVTQKYVDDTLAENQIAKFNNDKYFDYFGSTGEWGDFVSDYEITSSYPQDETGTVTGNVLKIEPSDNGIHYVWKYEFFEPIKLDQIENLYIRYNVTKSEKHLSKYEQIPLMMYAIPYSIEDSSITSYMNPEDGSNTKAYPFVFNEGQWCISRISVADFLITQSDTEIAGIRICTNAQLYVESIWYDTESYEDTELEDGVIMDFDDARYIDQVSKGNMGETPKLAILLSDYPEVPNANEGNGVLKIASVSLKASTAVAEIKLFNKVNASDYQYVCFNIYYDGRIDGEMVVKSKVVFQYSNLQSHSEENRHHFNHFIDDNNASDYYEEWQVAKVPVSVFADDDGTFEKISVLLEGTLLIDKIWLE